MSSIGRANGEEDPQDGEPGDGGKAILVGSDNADYSGGRVQDFASAEDAGQAEYKSTAAFSLIAIMKEQRDMSGYRDCGAIDGPPSSG